MTSVSISEIEVRLMALERIAVRPEGIKLRLRIDRSAR